MVVIWILMEGYIARCGDEAAFLVADNLTVVFDYRIGWLDFTLFKIVC